MSEQISVERQQNRMLVEAIKKIVTNPRTPNWIKNPLVDAVKEAKALKPCDTPVEEKKASRPSVNDFVEEEEIPLEVGCICRDALDPDDPCLYKIIAESFVIDGVQMYDVLVVKGDKKTPKGVTMHNVANYKLTAVQAPPSVQ